MIPLIEREVVEKNSWIERREFLDLLAVAQSAPGVFAVNISIFIGYRLRGVRGSVAAAVGNVLPSVVIILLIALFFGSFRENRVVNNFFMGVRPVVVALIAAPVFSVAKSARLSWTNGWIPLLAALLIVAFGVSPVYIILSAIVGGVLWGKFKGGKV